jgi:hypothetical protein
VAEHALVLVPAEKLELEVQESLAICGGEPMKALRITLIANAILEKQRTSIDGMSAGYAGRRKKAPKQSS